MKKQKLIAFHGDSKIKAEWISHAQAYRETDYSNKGASFRFIFDKYSHAAYEDEMGIPRSLACLGGNFFQSLTYKESLQWPEQFLKAIPVGADLSMVWPQFAHWLLVDEKFGAIEYAESESAEMVIQAVADLYHEWIKTGVRPRTTKWLKVRDDANDLADYDEIYASNVASYVTYIDGMYAAYAANAVANAANDTGDRKRVRLQQAKKLLELLSAAPIIKIKNSIK
jgi:hypothetical protein